MARIRVRFKVPGSLLDGSGHMLFGLNISYFIPWRMPDSQLRIVLTGTNEKDPLTLFEGVTNGA